jgi:predicted dehydrogenase
MRTGFIGLGLIGARRLRAARQQGCEVAFAVDPDASRCAALELDKTPFAASISALDETATRDLDAVFIAVPHDLIESTCRWAVERRANILCEKPMGLSLAQAQNISGMITAANLKFCAGFNKRFLPNVARLKQLLAEGAFGEVFRARVVMHHGGRPGMEREWKVKRARAGGGALIDPGVHLIDLSRHLFGGITVAGFDLQRRFWDVDVEDNCLLNLRAGSTRIDVEVSLTSWKNIFEIELFGRDGYAKITGRGANYGAMKIEYANRWFWNGDDRRVETDFGATDPSFDLETQAFLRWVSGEACDPSLSVAQDGIEALRVVDTVYS